MSERPELLIYRDLLISLTDEELNREIWMLDDHIEYLCEQVELAQNSQETSMERDIKEMTEMLKLAKLEKDRRMFERGYM
jgi:hypothetical protein